MGGKDTLDPDHHRRWISHGHGRVCFAVKLHLVHGISNK